MSPTEQMPPSDSPPAIAPPLSDGTTGARFVAECFWVGVTQDELRALDDRARACVAQLVSAGEVVSYLGSILIGIDEVVLCRFDGAEASVRRVAECARIPFERIVAVSESPWPTQGRR